MGEAERDNADQWLFYIELVSSLLVLAHTVSVLYDEYGSPGLMHFIVAKCCQRIAYQFGQWGLAAENRYHQVLEAQRMI